MSKRIVLLAMTSFVVLSGAAQASAAVDSPNSTIHRLCIGVGSDPSGSGRDGICVRTDPL